MTIAITTNGREGVRRERERGHLVDWKMRSRVSAPPKSLSHILSPRRLSAFNKPNQTTENRHCSSYRPYYPSLLFSFSIIWALEAIPLYDGSRSPACTVYVRSYFSGGST
ncbi:hypothetical protein FRC19_000152 [Serendipita sp. 401]|nr:hypothetical protein FRC19_000152 [Serendipita sp. 401]